MGKGFGVHKRDRIRLERVPLLYKLQSSDICYLVSESSLRPSSRDISDFDIVYFDTPVVDTFICKLCSNIFECSVKTECDHYFSFTCPCSVFKMRYLK